MMDPEIKARWVAALRSGEYPQTTGHLRDSNGFCCLGVLCDIYSQQTGVRWEEPNDVHPTYTMDGESDTPKSDIAVDWAGMKDSNPNVRIEHEEGPPWPGSISLAELNDNGQSFAEIADIIEKEL